MSIATPLILFALLFNLNVCCSTELQYTHKITSGVKGDWFGLGIEAKHNQVVVGAPVRGGGDDGELPPGGIMVRKNLWLQGPSGTKYLNVGAMNEHYIVAGGFVGDDFDKLDGFLYIYSATEPYDLKAQIPVFKKSNPWSMPGVAIGDDNTIVVPTTSSVTSVQVYAYDGDSTWHRERTWSYDGYRKTAVSISGDYIAVTSGRVFHPDDSAVLIYKRTDGEWNLSQTIRSPPNILFDCESMMMFKDGLVVKTYNHILLIYKLNQGTGEWILNGYVNVPLHMEGQPGMVAMGNDLIATSINDKNNNAVAMVYQKKIDGSWEEFARLTAEPMPKRETAEDCNRMIRIDGNKVFTARLLGKGVGSVYVHDLNKIKERKV